MAKQRTIKFSYDRNVENGTVMEQVEELREHLKEVAPNFQPNSVTYEGGVITFMGIENE